VPGTDGHDPEARRLEPLAGRHAGDIDARDVRPSGRIDGQTRLCEAGRLDEIGMFMRDENGVCTDEGVGLGPFAGIDDEHATVLFEANAGVGVFGDLHLRIVSGTRWRRVVSRSGLYAARFRARPGATRNRCVWLLGGGEHPVRFGAAAEGEPHSRGTRDEAGADAQAHRDKCPDRGGLGPRVCGGVCGRVGLV
jgi:hypothetical protein